MNAWARLVAPGLASLAIVGCGSPMTPEEGGVGSADGSATAGRPATGRTASPRGTLETSASGPVDDTRDGRGDDDDDDDDDDAADDDGDDGDETGECARPPTGPRSRFEFEDTFVCLFVQHERVGVPLVSRWLVESVETYNLSTPQDDQFLTFVGEIHASVAALHAALDDDLEAMGLVPCTPGGCATVYTPLVIPDALQLDLDEPVAFPNGRRLEDQAPDILLGHLLLDDRFAPPQTLAELPLGPPANDVPFGDAFPWLAPPHP